MHSAIKRPIAGMGMGDAVDYYKVLGIPRDASVDEVKKAYRCLSKVYHPDKAAHLEEPARKERERHMVALNVAHQVLMSPRQRLEYDQSTRLPEERSGPRTCGVTRERPVFYRSHPPSSEATASTASTTATDDSNSFASSGAYTTGTEVPHRVRVIPAPPPKPRYQSGPKYSQRARQARREDPSQYTTHRVGQPECGGLGSAPAQQTAPSSVFTPRGMDAGSALPPELPPGPVRNPTWLQRQMDIAHEWEKTHCPEDQTQETYQWKKATRGMWQEFKERRAQRTTEPSTGCDGRADGACGTAGDITSACYEDLSTCPADAVI